jgi:hypothetical protein
MRLCQARGYVQQSAIPPGPDQLIRNQEFDSAITALRHLLEVPNGETRGDLQNQSALGPAAQRPAFPKALRWQMSES